MPLVAVFMALFFLGGCSSKKPIPHHTQTFQHTILKPQKPHSETGSIKEALYDAYTRWRGTYYCYGGTSHRCIDCSAFVQRIYKEEFGLRLPRTTKEQAKVGYYVKKRNLLAGDIVLFHTGYATHHSGIYIEKGKFLHVSSKYGVSISNIHNPYWREKYTQARRVIVR